MKNKWPIVPLAEVLTQYREYVDSLEPRPYPKLSVKLYGKGVVLDAPADGGSLRMKRHQIARAGQVVLSEIWGKKGAIGLVPTEGDGALCTSHFFLFDVIVQRAYPGYLELIFRANFLQEQLDAGAKGTTGYAAVRPTHLLSATIPLPPLHEQRQILDKVNELAIRIQKVQELRHGSSIQLEDMFASALAGAFAPRSGWEEESVASFCEAPLYGYTASATIEPIGPRFLRITDIQDGHVDWTNVPFCNCSDPEKYLLQPNDVLFARTGATTGKSFLIRDCPEAVFASYLIRLRIERSVTPDYLYYYFQSPAYWSQIREQKRGTGQPNLNGRKLANIRVPIAPPNEQNEIVNYLTALHAKVRELRGLQGETEGGIERLLPSILDTAFKGELRF
jgi:restriction endonuclease S subunit